MKKKSSPNAAPKTPAKEIHLKAAGAPMKAAFPIVGIGASAGGLEGLEQFLKNVPVGSGMAFVIVQHLDPTRKDVMSELLQRATSMKVVQVEDRTLVRPDCVFVIPPNKGMSLLHGVLHLLAPVSPRGLRVPIDFFLRSLAIASFMASNCSELIATVTVFWATLRVHWRPRRWRGHHSGRLARVLKRTGSYNYHCDWHASHHVNVLPNRISGENNFESGTASKAQYSFSTGRQFPWLPSQSRRASMRRERR